MKHSGRDLIVSGDRVSAAGFADPAYDDYVPDAGAVCLAVLRRDGFISLDAGDQEGRLTTKPFVLPAGRLFVNVGVRKGGQLLVEMLEESHKVVATSKPIGRDHRRGEVKWEPESIAQMTAKVVSLRFTYRRAELYSYWVDEP